MEPVSLTIAQIREEIRRAGGEATGQGEPSSALAGRIFHEVFAALMGTQGLLTWQNALDPESLHNRRKLLDYIYTTLLGPRITQNQASLQERGPELLNLWLATRQMSDWIGGLLEMAYREHMLSFDRATQQWVGAEQICLVEQPLSWILREPDWKRPVQISGIPDAIWRNPRTGAWCVVEYKLGRTSPEADAAQACLYHLMLAASGLLEPNSATSMAVVNFLPERDERFYEGLKLASAQKSLKALIGRLAGVLPGQAQDQSAFLIEPPPPKHDHKELGRRLVEALQQYGPVVELRGSPIAGPAFLRYTIMPGKGVKVSSIINKADDIQMQLGLEHAPMIQKVGGKLVIDVQRPDREKVLFSSIRPQLPAPNDGGSRSRVMLGVDLFGKLQFADLNQTPHLLVSGTSGSGKTEWLRSAIAGLISMNTPDTLRLVLIDPKRNAFGDLKESPYLLDRKALAYPPEHSATELLDRLIAEMERRYKLFETNRVSDLREYVERWDPSVPRIVCLCDEYADLITDRATRREVEDRIRRLGAKARAAGIHLIIATQYPKADIVDGALKANLPGRVCLRTTTHVQSNVVLGRSGAERLLGNGDLFWVDIGDPVRLQAPLLDAEDRANILAGRAPAFAEAIGR
jgi:hypothetical protein